MYLHCFKRLLFGFILILFFTGFTNYPGKETAESFIRRMYDEKLYMDYDFLKSHCTEDLLQTLSDSFGYESDDVEYAIWLFRSGAQDDKYYLPYAVNESKILNIISEGNYWFTYTALDHGWEFANRIHLVESKDSFLIDDIYGLYNEGDFIDQNGNTINEFNPIVREVLEQKGTNASPQSIIKGICDLSQKKLGSRSVIYAYILRDAGLLYALWEDKSNALESLKKASNILELIYGQENEDFIKNLEHKAICYWGFGETEKALECYQTSLKLLEKVAGNNHGEYAACLEKIGNCYMEIDDYSAALDSFQKALSINDDPSRPFYMAGNLEGAIDMYKISLCYLYLGELQKGAEYVSAHSIRLRDFIVDLMVFHDENERARIWDEYGSFYTRHLFGISSDAFPSFLNHTAYDGALFGKGFLLNTEIEMRKLILESGDDKAVELFNEIVSEETALSLLQNDSKSQDEFKVLSLKLNAKKMDLYERTRVLGDFRKNLIMSWTDIQKALNDDDIAIEFEKYEGQDTTTFIALTLKKGYSEPHLIKLFSNYDLKKIKPSRYYSSPTMTDLVWGKLSKELEGVKNVYFSPVGELYNIGIEHLLDSDGNHLISEKRNYYRLTSTRELVKGQKNRKMADVIVYGGIQYDMLPKSKLTGEESESELFAIAATQSYTPIIRDLKSLNNSGTRSGWEYLPGTKAEAEAISSTLSSKKIQNVLLEGENGTEESFKALSGAKKDVIHIATHGFYWTETEADRRDENTSSFMMSDESSAPTEDKALSRSGLLFAGAQNAFEGKEIPIDVEDGILTAKEISKMDLRNTNLVVISACQSGLGEVTGDGVFGLQRGFKKAGVQSIVMSLWEVSDEATKIMMTRFYENLARGRSKYDSFRDAQNYLRKYDGGLYDEPEYYAAFVLLDAIK